jgi:hypothetical protein
MVRVKHMSVGAVGVMSCGLMVTGGVVTSGFSVMSCGALVMLGGLQMMLVGWMASLRWFLCHAFSPLMHTRVKN